MVGGAPFGLEADTPEGVDKLFIEKIRDVFRDLDPDQVSLASDAPHQITPVMRSMRSLDSSERRDLYDIARIEDQRAWYSKKAAWNQDRGMLFGVLALLLEVAGLVLAGLKAALVVELDFLGLVAAVGAGVAAWSQAKQYQMLGSAYSIAAQELAAIRDDMGVERTEGEWALFVDDCEEAISREHTLWHASRIGLS